MSPPIRRVMVTGAAGFIGSRFVRLLLEEERFEQVVSFDLLTYAGNLRNLDGVLEHPAHVFVRGDIASAEDVASALDRHPVDAIVNFAAESHVDRSLHDPAAFVRTNVLGAATLLDAARRRDIRRFVQVSTDEVYGSLSDDAPPFTEGTPLAPRSPYSASKAAADQLALSYHHTFGTPVVVTRCSNNYGPRQFPEKLIPLAILRLASGEPVPVYGDGRNVRDWIHVEDHCRGVLAALLRGRAGEVYNFGANCERRNLDIVHALLRELDRPDTLIRFVKDRPGHDWRYAIDAAKARAELGWSPRVDFARGLGETVRWYLDNVEWTRSVQSGEYQRFYELHYGPRGA